MPQPKPNHTRIETQIWPGLAICTALQMVLSVDESPGIGEDFETLGRSISKPLADLIMLFLLANLPAALTELSLQEQVADLEPEGFLDWVKGLDAAKLSSRAGTCDHEENRQPHEAVRSPKSAEWENPREWYLAIASEAQLAQVQQLLERTL